MVSNEVLLVSRSPPFRLNLALLLRHWKEYGPPSLPTSSHSRDLSSLDDLMLNSDQLHA